jgi:hypothetical protein
MSTLSECFKLDKLIFILMFSVLFLCQCPTESGDFIQASAFIESSGSIYQYSSERWFPFPKAAENEYKQVSLNQEHNGFVLKYVRKSSG